MRTAQRIATLESELSTMRMDATQLGAQIRANETQIAARRQSVQQKKELESRPRIEAILAVLRSAGAHSRLPRSSPASSRPSETTT
jgi:hypothetical protein